tara:strand:- start:912 stop:1091 length:180 start_codon:yes stop_codon:yes gene_type:complete
MQKKVNKCCECERNEGIVEKEKIYCAECYMFNNNILSRVVRSTKRRYKYKSINYNKTLH